jgi:hypothetical protein
MPVKVTHDTELYQINGGILYLAAWSGSTSPVYGDYYDVGNCLEFSFEVAVEKLEHYHYRGKRKVKDKVVIMETGYTLKFKLDEPSLVNLASFVKGSIEGNVIHGLQAAQQEYAVRFVEDSYVGEDKVYEFWRCDISPAGGFNLISIDQWKEMEFEGEGLADDANHATSPLFDITVAASTTS